MLGKSCNINFEKLTLEVQPDRKLKAKWTVDIADDLKNLHGIDISDELVAAMGDIPAAMLVNIESHFEGRFYPSPTVGIIQCDKFVHVIKEDGKDVNLRMSKEDFIARYFIDLL